MSPPATERPGAAELAAAVRRGELDPVELVEQSLARIAEVDAALGAFVHVDASAARAEAAQRAAEVGRGEPLGPLHGVPFAVKDLYDVRGQVSRAGSAVPAGPPAARDAAAVARVRAAGGVLVGRTRTHEFAWGITTQHAWLGGTRNPVDPARVPGGSSGGSAAAVAAGLVPLALGTDTGCSIRLPAAWCGLVGHKPTYGLVPLDGVVPLAPSLDHAGALVADVASARLALAVLSGQEPEEPADARGVRYGVAGAADLPAGVAARGRPVTIPRAGQLVEIYGALQGAEALAWHRATGRWPTHAERYGPDVRARLERAERLTQAQVAAAAADRRALRAEVAALFEQVDLLLLPVATCPPSRVTIPDRADDGRDLREAVLPWTVLANLCGLPACSVPAGRVAGLPVGVQVVGPPHRDDLVLAAAGLLLGGSSS